MFIATLSLAAAFALSAEEPRGERAVAETPLAELFSADDYPAEALRQRLEGRVQVRFRVGADGRVRECKAASSSGHAVLDRATCDLIVERGRFRPARNAQGEAVSDTLTTRVRWQLPDPAQTSLGREHAVFRMSRAGSTTICALTINGAVLQPPSEACGYVFGPMTRLIDADSGRGEHELILSQVFEPLGQGQPEPVPDMPGERLMRFEADISIADDGSVTCTTRHIDGGAGTLDLTIDQFEPCHNYMEARFPPRQGEAERRARYHGTFYLVRPGAT